MLGKRKRETRVVSSKLQQLSTWNIEHEEADNNYDVFRKHFETNFAPLPELTPIVSATQTYSIDKISDEQSENSEWSGLSDSGRISPDVEIVDCATESTKQDEQDDNVIKKAFMSSKPPQQAKKQANPITTTPSEESMAEALNLKHDLDLQRLLEESHLLEQSKVSSTPGKQRQIAIDLRLQELGSKTSLYTQTTMPQSHRRGIEQKAAAKATARRVQARQNGVVLEKLVKEKNSHNRRRDRAPDAPAVGRFQSGTLKLSQKDIANIQGPSVAVTGRRNKRR